MEIKLSDFIKIIDKTGHWGATAAAIYGTGHISISLIFIENRSAFLDTNTFFAALSLMSLGFAYRIAYSPRRIKKKLEIISQMVEEELLDEDQADIAQRSLAVRLADNIVYAIEKTIDKEFDNFMEFIGKTKTTKSRRDDIQRLWEKFRSQK
jgi:hypothetical protein